MTRGTTTQAPVSGARRIVESQAPQRIAAPTGRVSHNNVAPVLGENLYVGEPRVVGVVDEYFQDGPIIEDAHPITTLSGEYISPISARPGLDANIPFAPKSTYVPSGSEMDLQTIDGVGEGPV